MFSFTPHFATNIISISTVKQTSSVTLSSSTDPKMKLTVGLMFLILLSLASAAPAPAAQFNSFSPSQNCLQSNCQQNNQNQNFNFGGFGSQFGGFGGFGGGFGNRGFGGGFGNRGFGGGFVGKWSKEKKNEASIYISTVQLTICYSICVLKIYFIDSNYLFFYKTALTSLIIDYILSLTLSNSSLVTNCLHDVSGLKQLKMCAVFKKRVYLICMGTWVKGLW